jgi:hypothetical protein
MFTWGPQQLGASGLVDPLFASVQLLLHMDATFSDSSPSPKTVTPSGNAQISALQSRFGGSSGYFDGSGDFLTTNLATSAFGTNDFCIEGWVWPESAGNGAFRDLVGSGTAAGQFDLHLDTHNPPRLRYFMRDTSGASSDLAFGPLLTTNAWNHFAFTRSGVTFRAFINGTAAGIPTQNGSFNFNFNSSSPISLARNLIQSSLRGYLDEVRITIGAARYTANFTAPTAPYPDA